MKRFFLQTLQLVITLIRKVRRTGSGPTWNWWNDSSSKVVKYPFQLPPFVLAARLGDAVLPPGMVNVLPTPPSHTIHPTASVFLYFWSLLSFLFIHLTASAAAWCKVHECLSSAMHAELELWVSDSIWSVDRHSGTTFPSFTISGSRFEVCAEMMQSQHQIKSSLECSWALSPRWPDWLVGRRTQGSKLHSLLQFFAWCRAKKAQENGIDACSVCCCVCARAEMKNVLKMKS